jgi:hypothetical protein
MKKKQFKVMLPDGLRAWLEKSATEDGTSIAEQIRLFLEAASSETDLPAAVHDLLTVITDLRPLIRQQTGHDWWQAPEAFEIFCSALVARLERWRPQKPSGKPPERLRPLVHSSDPKQVGLALDTVLMSRSGLAEDLPGYNRSAFRGAMRELRKGEGVRRRGKQMKHREENKR